MSADAVLLTFIKLVTMTLGLVTTRLLSQYLSVHDYGTYSQVLLIVSTVSSLTIFGMLDGMRFFYCKDNDADKREAYIATIFVFQLVLGTVAGGIVMTLSAPLCQYFDNPDIKGLLIFAAALPMFQNLIGSLQVLIVSVGQARKLALRNLIVSVARLATVICIVLLVRNIAVLMTVTLALDISQIVYFVLVLWKSGCNIRLTRADIHLLGDILRYCTPMAIFILVSSINRDLDKYLISVMTDTETLARYANASKQLPFDVIISSFGTVLAPQIARLFAENAKEEASKLYKAFLEITYISTGILCFAALSAAPQLVKLLYSNKYMNGLPIFRIYILVDLLRFTNMTLVLSAAGQTKRLMIIGLGTIALNAALNFSFYQIWGVMGPAVATLMVTGAVGILMLYFSARAFGTRLSRLFDGKYLMLFATESIGLTLLLELCSRYLRNLDMHYFFALMVIAGLYGVIMLLLNGKRLLSNMKKVSNIAKTERDGWGSD